MTDPATPPFSRSGWSSSQLHHVETELLKEYPNLSRHVIHKAVALAQEVIDPAHGTVRLLAHTRRTLGSSGFVETAYEARAGYRLPA